MAASDLAQREAALDTSASFIVQAPAGSGKTELLTQRFLKLLSKVQKPDQVLAITFTRKATQEMRERIIDRLGQATRGEVPGAPHEITAFELAQKVLERDREAGWNLQKNPGRLQIHTIDGLCARITGRAPLVGHGVAGLGVIEDAVPLYRKAAQRLIEDMGGTGSLPGVHEALGRVLAHVQGNTAQLLELLTGMLGRRDQWLGRMGVGHESMEWALSSLQAAELGYLQQVLGQTRIEEILDRLAALAAHVDDPATAGAFLHARDRAARAPGSPELRLRFVLAGLRCVATRAGTPLSPRSAQGKIMPGRSGGDREANIGALKDVLSDWYGNDLLVKAFKRFVTKPPLDDHPEGRAILEDFRLLLRYATAELQVFFVEQGQADFQYFADMAMRALGRDEEPGEALLIEDVGLAHILMDEFQDTSHTQYGLVRRLVSGWQEGDGRTLFLVGDPMQSIYRFRQADVKLFKQVYASGRLGEVPLHRLRLTSNFRSLKEVIDWVNEHFSRIFEPPPGLGTGAVGYVPVTPERGEGGRVVPHAWPESVGDKEEARRIAELAGRVLAQTPQASVAVLARKRKQLEGVAAALKKAGIRFDAVEVERLGERPVVCDLVALTRAILHPADRIAWLALLRAPWCGLAPGQMHAVAGEDPGVDVLSRMAGDASIASLPKAQARRVKMLHETMSAVLAKRGRWPLARLVEVAWLRCKGPYAVGSAVELDNAQAYFDLLAGIEAEGPDDLMGTLQERLDKLYAGSTSGRVQLMTIHKAKGLEFDVVILPGLQSGGGGGDRPMLRVNELVLDGQDGIIMAPVKHRGMDGESLYDYLGQLDNEEEACEAQRTLYVAATRAKRELHLFGGWKMTGSGKNRKPGCASGTFMNLLWPCFEALIDPDAGHVKDAPEPEEPPMLLQLRLQGEPGLQVDIPADSEESPDIEWRIPEPNAVALGEALHLWLELIHDHWDRGWSAEWFEEHHDALKSTLVRAGADARVLPESSSKLLDMLCRMLKSREGRAIVSPEGKPDSWAEIALYSREGVHLRKNILDRLYRDGQGGCLIVDYKTGPGDEAQRAKWAKQLELYRSLLGDIYKDVPIQSRFFKP